MYRIPLNVIVFLVLVIDIPGAQGFMECAALLGAAALNMIFLKRMMLKATEAMASCCKCPRGNEMKWNILQGALYFFGRYDCGKKRDGGI